MKMVLTFIDHYTDTCEKGLRFTYCAHLIIDPYNLNVQELCKGTQNPDLKRSIFKEASGHLLTIAKQHEGYQTLWDICFDLNSTELLRNLMVQISQR